MTRRASLIRAARESLGLTQWQFAQFIGIDPSLVSRWERGRAEPRPETVRRIVALLSGETIPDAWADLDAVVGVLVLCGAKQGEAVHARPDPIAHSRVR